MEATPVQVGDLVTVRGRGHRGPDPDVWEVVDVRRGAARLEGRSVRLGGLRRWEPFELLARYAESDDGA